MLKNNLYNKTKKLIYRIYDSMSMYWDFLDGKWEYEETKWDT